MKQDGTNILKRLEICCERAGGKPLLAKATNMSRSQLFRYVKGTTHVPTDRLIDIANASNVHPYWLLTGEGSPDIPPIQGFISTDQPLTIDAKSLTECLAMAEQIDRDYNFHMTPSHKAEFVFALYHGVVYEAKLYRKPIQFESSKALEIYGFLSNIQGEMPRRLMLNIIDVLHKSSNGLLSELEIRTFCNYLNTAIRGYYDHATLGQPYFDRMGYSLEEDNAKSIDEFLKEIKQKHILREEHIKILDLGCGNGRYLLHFAKDKRLKLTGMDNNKLAQKICQSYEAAGKLPAHTFVEGDIYKMPFPDSSFDLIFASASIFHIPFLANSDHGFNQAMQEIRRVLRPKGLIYIYSRYGNGFEPFPFFQLHNEGSIRQICQKNAFQMLWFKKFFWQDSIEFIPKVGFNNWFSTLLSKT